MPSLSEALKHNNVQKSYITGEALFDEELAAVHSSTSYTKLTGSGLPARSFTELSGFPGNGQVSIMINLALNALHNGNTVVFVSCNWNRFPIECARQLPEWNAFQFEPSIIEIIFSKLEDFFTLDITKYTGSLVIVEGYDSLVKTIWNKPVKSRAYTCLLSTMKSWSKYACIIALCGVTKYYSTDGRTMFCPRSEPAVGINPQETVRLMIYKNQNGVNTLSTGFGFKICDHKIVSFPDSRANLAIVLPMLTSKRRTTPARFTPTPIKTEDSTLSSIESTRSYMKRRKSVSSPVKLLESEPKSARTTKSPKVDGQQYCDKNDDCTNTINDVPILSFKDSMNLTTPTHFTHSLKEESATVHRQSHNPDQNERIIPSHHIETLPQRKETPQRFSNLEEMTQSECHVVPNSQIEIRDSNCWL